LPPAQREDTGRTAIMRCDGYDKESRQATFTLTDEAGEALPAIQAGGALRVREGDWMTLNSLRDGETEEPPAGKRIVHGRLSVIEKITENQLRLRLQPLSFKNSKFRFGHRMIEPEQGLLYTLDEMADDLNADKLLEACRNAGTNHLYQWLDKPQLGQTPRAIRPSRLRTAKHVADIAHVLQTPFGLTGAQRKVIGEFIADRVLVLQGPPGTGKSHTLGFATLARALAQQSDARPFRIAVCAKTHAAVQIALASIRASADKLLSGENVSSEDAALLQSLASLRVWKICNDESELLPDGIECLLADGNQRMKAGEQWAHLMSESLVCIGGTPGGFYNLIKRGASKGKGIDWSNKYFDLVLVDEASQMGQAEALLAAAFLREDGQFIAIGDHRQMPPILIHAWDQDSRRELEHVRPHLSIFESLRELKFANTALDESFRIPEEVADFLGRHVYAADGIEFHSHNRQRLTPLSVNSGLPEWIKAALAPEHPVVLIEHEEAGSQQANEFEAGIIAELARVASGHLGLNAKAGFGIVVPHRAQKALLRERLPEYAEAIDTVERFQGGERDLIIVSATVSDREYASAESEFLLEPRRFTVAVSRPKRKVIIVASRSVFDLVPSDLDAYERGSLWKRLRHDVEQRVLWQGKIKGHTVSVRVL
jgi:AAA domain